MTRTIFARTSMARLALFGLGAATASALLAGPAFADPAAGPAPQPVAPASPADPATNPAQPGTPVAGPATAPSLAGKVVFLDPGHQGSATPAQLNQQVSDGRGSTKACQTAGATSIYKVPEHTINWKVVKLIQKQLESQGAKVVLSRADDTGWGGCITDRAAAANASGADLAVSVHADSSSNHADPTKSGFHMIVPTLPIADQAVNKAQSVGGLQASKDIRDAMKAAGFKESNYIITNDGLSTRFDVAGPALTKVPDAFIEMGNLSNPTEAKDLASPAGEQRYANAISNGITTFLATSSGAQQATTPSNTIDNIPSLPLNNPNNGSQSPSSPDLVGNVQNFINNLSSNGMNLANPSTGGTNPLGGTSLDNISQQLSSILSGNNGNAIGSNIQGVPGATGNTGAGGITDALKNIPGVGQLLQGAQGIGNETGINNFLQNLQSAPIPGASVASPGANGVQPFAPPAASAPVGSAPAVVPAAHH